MKKLRTLAFVVLGFAVVGPRTIARAQEVPPPAPVDPAATIDAASASAPDQAPPAESGAAAPPPAETGASAAARGDTEPSATAPADAETNVETAAEASADAPLSAAELEQMGLELDSPGLDTGIKFSGFSDFTVFTPIKPQGAVSALLPRQTSFYVGNFNLYVSKNLSQAFRTMAEVRFTYLPNGRAAGTGFGDPVDTTTSDYAENSRTMRWGGIIMQRIYLEWTLQRLATLRVGQFLTPYGIWNVDHGSPAYIPVQRPYAVNSDYFPERQTGFELFGRMDAGNYNSFGYHLTLSNGVGPVSEYKDLDKNKALGGRLYWENHSVGYLRVGTSGYYGRNTDGVVATSISGTAVQVTDKVNLQYDALALGADLLFKIKGFYFQAEWVSQQRRYTREGRTAHSVVLGPVPKGFASDSFSWGGYGLLAYQFKWFGVTPYFMTQYNSQIYTDPLYDARVKVLVYHAGLNVHPIDAVTLKAEYRHGTFPDGISFFDGSVQAMQFQAAWAF